MCGSDLKRMVEFYSQEQASCIAVQHVESQHLDKYGVVDLAEKFTEHARIAGIVEKPRPERAPSNFGVIGRYVLSPRIFELLEQTKPGSGGEIQLTDAIARLLREEVVYAFKISGKRYDCGNKMGYLEATVQYALQHAEVGRDFRNYVASLRLDDTQ